MALKPPVREQGTAAPAGRRQEALVVGGFAGTLFLALVVGLVICWSWGGAADENGGTPAPAAAPVLAKAAPAEPVPRPQPPADPPPQAPVNPPSKERTPAAPEPEVAGPAKDPAGRAPAEEQTPDEPPTKGLTPADPPVEEPAPSKPTPSSTNPGLVPPGDDPRAQLASLLFPGGLDPRTQPPGLVPRNPPKAPTGPPAPQLPKGQADDRAGGTMIDFMKVQARGKRFCIIADNSGSMKGEPLAKVQREMVRTLQQIPPDCQFFVMFFNSQPVPMPNQDWLNGGPAALNRVVPWIGSIRSGDGTQPTPAFELAFRLNPRPDVIFFLTDGLMPKNVPARVAALNAGRPKVTIHTLMAVGRSQPTPPVLNPRVRPHVVQQLTMTNQAKLREAQQQLQRIAFESGGTFRLVMD